MTDQSPEAPPPTVNVEAGAIRENLAKFIAASPKSLEYPGRFNLGVASALDRDCIVQALRSVEKLTKERDDLAQACAELERRVIIAGLQAKLATMRSEDVQTIARRLKGCVERRELPTWAEIDFAATALLTTLRSSASAVGEDDLSRATALLRKMDDVLHRRFPRCRDCADFDGACPHSELPCGLTGRIEQIIALLASRSPSPSGDGWQLAPRTISMSMCSAAEKYLDSVTLRSEKPLTAPRGFRWPDLWTALLAAAPPPPSSPQGGEQK